MVPIAIFCAVSAIIGMKIGRFIRQKIDTETFKRGLLILFLLIGVRLIASAIGTMGFY
jgi:uncharacterized membrane protein YfcA